VPDRFFWALPPAEDDGTEPTFEDAETLAEPSPKMPRRMH
jgi:hydroxymethylpyrimidine/phosphomethylpyrimidine kinase